MATGKEFANIEQYKLMGYSDFGEKFLDYLKDYVKVAQNRIWDADAVIDDALEITGDAADSIAITGSSYSTDGLGNILKIADATVNSGIKFENTSSTPYYVGLKHVEIPSGITINTRTGYPIYNGWIDEIGVSAAPDTVTNNGTTITFKVDSVTESAVTNAGRQVLVYKNVAAKDATTDSVAIETCTVTWSGTQNEITTTGVLGQSSVSTTASDYTVVLLGPSVKKNTDLRTSDGYVFVGIVTGNGGTPTVFDTTDQQVVSVTLSQLGQLFATADNGRLKIDIRPETGEEGVNQLVVRDEDNYINFSVDEVGKTLMRGVPTLNTVNTGYKHPSILQGKFPYTVSGFYEGRCMTSGYIDGVKKYFLFCNGSSSANIYVRVLDVNTGGVDSETEITSHFSYTNKTQPCSAFISGGYAYIACMNDSNAATQVVQALDITDWSVKPGWPATGIVDSTYSASIQYDDVGKLLIDLDGDKFLYLVANLTNQIKIISKTNGSTIAQGVGDNPDTGDTYVPKTMTTDGVNVFWSTTHGVADNGYIMSAKLSDPTQGSGVNDFPISGDLSVDGRTDIDFGLSLEYCNGIIIHTTTTEYLFGTRRITSSNIDSSWLYSYDDTSGAKLSIGDVTTDGVNFWFASQIGFYSANPASVSGRNITYKEIINVFSEYKTNGFIENNTFEAPATFYFDGDNILYTGGNQSFGQSIVVIENALFSKPSGRIGQPTDTALNQSLSGAVTLDILRGIKYYPITITGNITSFDLDVSDFDYTNDNYTAVIGFKASGGNYTIDGFPTSNQYRVWDGPTPPFTVNDGKVRILTATITAFGSSNKIIVFSMGNEAVQI